MHCGIFIISIKTISSLPPAQNKEQLRSEATNPLSKLKKDVDAMGNKLGSLTRKPTKLKTTETVNYNKNYIYVYIDFTEKFHV